MTPKIWSYKTLRRSLKNPFYLRPWIVQFIKKVALNKTGFIKNDAVKKSANLLGSYMYTFIDATFILYVADLYKTQLSILTHDAKNICTLAI
jgi:hypothetical protein